MLSDELYYMHIRNSLIARAKAVHADNNGNLLSLSVLTEGYYREILSILLECNLVNVNESRPNTPEIDLIDTGKRMMVQVSATCDSKHIRNKIKHSVCGIKIPENENWQFFFVPITEKAPQLRKDFDLPKGVSFDRSNNILDIQRIMRLVQHAGIDRQEMLYHLVKKYDTTEKDNLEIRNQLDGLLLAIWRNHRSFKLMQADEIDLRLLPKVKNISQFTALGKTKEDSIDSPVWSIIYNSWKLPENHPIVIKGGGGKIGRAHV